MPLHLRIENTRLAASKQLDPDRRANLGQFMTPSAIATFMASLFQRWPDDTRLLDPGAGIGSLYAHHFSGGALRWPREHKKPNALEVNDATRKWLMPQGWYAITKRFSAKEEKRRLVAYVVDPSKLPHEFYGFENHLNVIHANKKGIAPALARGIALFLNSTIVDLHFRNFSGHTQVNATDLRSMRFPDLDVLTELGEWAAKHDNPSQDQIDQFIESHNGD